MGGVDEANKENEVGSRVHSGVWVVLGWGLGWVGAACALFHKAPVPCNPHEDTSERRCLQVHSHSHSA